MTSTAAVSGSSRRHGNGSPDNKESTKSFETARETISSLSTASRNTEPRETPKSPNPPQQESTDDVSVEESNGFTTSHRIILVLLIFLAYLFLLYCVYLIFPNLKPEERQHMKIPWNLQEAKSLAAVLDRYTDSHYWTVLSGFTLVYIFLQTFALPGSIFLSIMSGFLFSFLTALFLVCFCAACGASGCYMISWLVAGPFIQSRYPEVIEQWSEKVAEERDNLLNFIIFLRITPILPNWLINIVAPQIGVPLSTFWIGTFIGVIPPSALAVQAGITLQNMTSPTDHISWTSITILGIIALGSLVPVLIRRLSQ